MGLTYLDARMLLESQHSGTSFAQTLTIAHLSLNLHPAEVAELQALSRSAERASGKADGLAGYKFGDYSDEFILGALGAGSLEVMDYSPYQGATLVHDLNHPVPETLHEKYDAVIDAGSIEHVFDVPMALRNMMNMVKVGGLVFLKSPANNLLGHGFYQFGPELMYRVFSEQSGFRVERMLLVECAYPSIEIRPFRRAFEVADPQDVRERIGLVSKRPVMILVQARRVERRPVLATAPLQSDYVDQWQGGGSVPKQGAVRRLLDWLPQPVRLRLRGYRELRRYSWSNRKHYRRVDH